MKQGFTLAEVLITIGIIGVVAAITIPTMMSNYRKKIKSTRLKHFHSVLQQAVRMKIGEDSAIDASMLIRFDPDATMQFVKTNYAPYIKFSTLKKSELGVIAGFPDGSGAEFIKNSTPNGSTSNTYIIFCPEYKDCDPSGITSSDTNKLSNSTTRFEFWTGQTSVPWSNKYEDEPSQTRDIALEKCKNDSQSYCTKLLYLDKWEFKHDYPFKI